MKYHREIDQFLCDRLWHRIGVGGSIFVLFLGGLLGGPVGAVAGAVGGGVLGHEAHKANHPKVDASGTRVKREGAGTKTGALGGAVAGGLVGGPIGAVAGAVGGGILGHEVHKANHPKVVVPAQSGAVVA